MSLLYIVLIGLAAGFLAGLIMKGKGFGLIVNILVGIAGAFIGGWLLGELGVSAGDGLIGSLITAVIGAVVLLFVLSLFKKKMIDIKFILYQKDNQSTHLILLFVFAF